MELKRVVVTGLGALTPIGNNLQEYWQGLVNGVSGAAGITKFDPSKFKTQFACEVKNFDIANFIDRKEARKMDEFAQYAMVVADEAIKHSNLDIEKVDQRNSIGISSMQYRISSMNGKFKIESSPGNGCKIIFNIPIRNAT